MEQGIVQKIRQETSVWGLWCFWFHMILALIVSALLIYFGLYLRKNPSAGCTQPIIALVQSITASSNNKSFNIVVRFTDLQGNTRYENLTSSTYSPVGSPLNIFYSPLDPSIVCLQKSNSSFYIILGIVILVGHFLWGCLIYYSKTLRALYGTYCAFNLIDSLFHW